jgi:predicted permease
MGTFLLRAALRFVPRSWRDAVARDLEEEARAGRHGAVWCAWHALRAGVRLRPHFGLDAFMTDVRYAVRSLIRARGFAAAAIMTIVLGIGVNLAVFTVVDRALFRPLPFAHMERLVFVTPYSEESGTRYFSFNRRLFLEGRRGLPGVEDMASAGFTTNYAISERPGDTVALTDVSYNLLDVLGAVPALGRGFQRDDVVAGRDVAMVSHETWHSRFGASRDIFDLRLRSGNRTIQVVGVLPRGFIAPAVNRGRRFDGVVMAKDLLESLETTSDATAPGVARLAPGTSIAVANRQYEALATRLDPELRRPGQARGPRVRFEPLRPALFWYAYDYLWLLTAAAALVGALACANLASLLLARGRSREQQVALRASLGASPSRLLTVELAQSLLICAVACLISVGAMAVSTGALRAIAPVGLRPFVLQGPDVRVVLLATLAAVASAMLAGAVPAWRATRTSLLAVLQRGAGAPAHARRRHAGKAVLAIEAAIGVVLVAGAAVAGRSLAGLLTTDTGFNRHGLYLVTTEAQGERRGGDDTAELARARGILEVLRRQPGVARAAGIDSMPAAGMAPHINVTWDVAGRVGLWEATEAFFETIGARTIAGRTLASDDLNADRPVAVLTEAAARRFWPDAPSGAAIGRQIIPLPDPRNNVVDQPRRQVVGIVADIRDRPDEPAAPRVFVPARAADGFWFLQFVVRMVNGSQVLDRERLRRELAEQYGVRNVDVGPAASQIASALEQPRTQTIMFGSFAVVGLLLAALGLFAVASFDVALRRYELGVRGALGASGAALRRLVIADALRPVAIGCAAGVLAAWWLAQFIQSQVHQIDARDPGTLALVVAVLLATAAAAAWLPAYRAGRTDPAEVLRSQ